MSAAVASDNSTGETRPHSDAKIAFRGVTKLFSEKNRPVQALAGVDLDILPGEFLCLLGPSGCGKTTLLRIAAGLETQTNGTATLWHDDPRRPLRSVVFQDHGVLPWLTVRDNVAFGLKARGMGKAERRAEAERFLATVGLGGFENALPHQLSGGMRQRVSIARALIIDPEILLMDEPFASLDEQSKLTLQGELLSIWESNRKTVLYITHSIDEAIALADRIVVMTARPGQIREIIDLREKFKRPRSIETVRANPYYPETFQRIWALLKPPSLLNVGRMQ